MTSDQIFQHLIGPAVLLGAAALIFYLNRWSRVARDRRLATLAGGAPPAPDRPWPWIRGLIGGVVLASIYLLAFRGESFFPNVRWDNGGGALLMSFSFLFLGPFVAGAITVYQGSAREPLPVTQWVVAPWIPILINLAIALGIAWEGMICAIFILPPAMISASLGGVAAGFLQRSLHSRASKVTLSCLAALPLLLVFVEIKLQQPLELRTVHTEIRIHAPAAVVWANIRRVRAISPAELRPSWANTIGFPRPVEATLSFEGIGGVRNASFERGLNFVETVTEWQPGHRIAFTIRADTAQIPRTTLDEHVTVGGRFFDVLSGEYTIEALPGGDIELHLSSHQRLSTDFNPYAALWSDAVMRDMQNNILHVIQGRCEARDAQQLSLTAVP